MKSKFPIRMLCFGLGAFLFTSRSSAAVSDPFARYLAGVKSDKPEGTISRFGDECGIDLGRVPAKYAVSVGGPYIVVRNLAAGIRRLESDFYTSVEVRADKNNKELVILWPNDEGVETRELLCYAGDRLEKAEIIQWDFDPDLRTKSGVWGYLRRWETGSDGKLLIVKQSFVDTLERSIQKPKLDSEEEKNLQWTPDLDRLSKLKLPTALFQ